MPLQNTTSSYGSVAKAFHWVMAALIILNLIVGLKMAGLPVGPDKFKLYGWHKSFGALVLILVSLRLAWRLANVTPLLPGTIRPFEQTLARLGHFALYALMFAMPLSGWAMSSAAGLPVSFFGLFILPDLVEPNQALKATLMELHELMGFALIGMILLHVLAALLHHFYYKNNVLRRMLPFVKEEKYAQDSDTMVGC